MTCRQTRGNADSLAGSWAHALAVPTRTLTTSEPEAPVKPEERPTLPPQREDPHYPTHTPPKPGTQPAAPCPGTDDPDEGYPACRQVSSRGDRHGNSVS